MLFIAIFKEVLIPRYDSFYEKQIEEMIYLAKTIELRS